MTDEIRRALWLSDKTHTIDGDTRPNPEHLFDDSAPEVFGQMLRIVCGRGVVLLDRPAAYLLGLPVEAPLPTGNDARNHAVAMQLRTCGFTVKEIGRWFHVKHKDVAGPGAWFGLSQFLDGDYFPLQGEHPEHVTSALAEWDRITGHTWRGASGDAGNAILRAQKYRYRGQQTGATWWSWEGPEGDPIELPYLPNTWRRATEAPEAIYGYDRVRAYLSAMTCTPVAAQGLKHTKHTQYTKGEAGWYLCHVGPWEFEHIMPSPAGYSADDMTRPVWLTHPTVALLEEMQAEGFITYGVLDSWTAPATPIMTDYGKALRKAWQDTRGIEDETVRALVRRGIKGAYRLGHGFWRSKNSDVQRPDWAAAVTAMSRSNLWRRLFKLWENGGNFLGPVPYFIDTDNVYFDHPISPEGWKIWDGERPDLDEVTELGHWRTMPVRRRKRPVSRETEAANVDTVSRETAAV